MIEYFPTFFIFLISHVWCHSLKPDMFPFSAWPSLQPPWSSMVIHGSCISPSFSLLLTGMCRTCTLIRQMSLPNSNWSQSTLFSSCPMTLSSALPQLSPFHQHPDLSLRKTILKPMQLWSPSPNTFSTSTPVTWLGLFPNTRSLNHTPQVRLSIYCVRKPSWINLTNSAPSNPFALNKSQPILGKIKVATNTTLWLLHHSVICLSIWSFNPRRLLGGWWPTI